MWLVYPLFAYTYNSTTDKAIPYRYVATCVCVYLQSLYKSVLFLNFN